MRTRREQWGSLATRATRRPALHDLWAAADAGVRTATAELTASGWMFLESAHWPGRQTLIERILIGPGGIIVIDSGAWVGQIRVIGGVVQQNGFWREQETAAVAGSAGAVSAILRPHHRTAVRAMICVLDDQFQEQVVSPGVQVVAISALVGTLGKLPPRLTADEVVTVHGYLAELLLTAAPPEQMTTQALDTLQGQTWWILDGASAHLETGSLPVKESNPPFGSAMQPAAPPIRARRRRAAAAAHSQWMLTLRVLFVLLLLLVVLVVGPVAWRAAAQPDALAARASHASSVSHTSLMSGESR